MGTVNKEQFVIEGLGSKKVLQGEIEVRGAKNAVLKAFAAVLLFNSKITVSNVPVIEDVDRMLELLTDLGVVVEKGRSKSYRLSVKTIVKTELKEEISKKLRASIVLAGPLLARAGQVSFPYPGGCVIGKRPIDIFLDGFARMGAKIKERDGQYFLSVPKNSRLRGAEIFFKTPSVTATETFMMAGVLAQGKTVLRNCALEPETVSLGKWLRACGAKISGLGTPMVEIMGGSLLSGRDRPYVTIPDRIEAGSFLVLAALAGRDVKVKKCEPQHLHALINFLAVAGVDLTVGKDFIRVTDRGKKDLSAVDIKTHEYPGFPTDLQAPTAVLLTQATGESFLFETIFEGRLGYLDTLNQMGANIKILDAHRAIIHGPTPLHGREVESPDLRAGLAFLLAGAVASGPSIVHNVYYIDRGYEKIDERLTKLGLKIRRECHS